jgi:hypothetical protein
MTDSYNDPATGLPMTLPDAPGDYSETVIRKEPIQYDDYGHPITPESAAPFAPLTPQQAADAGPGRSKRGDRSRRRFPV